MLDAMARRAAASLPIHLDLQSGDDLHEQIYRDLRRAIIARILRPHTRIASTRAMAADLCVSRTTTQLALDKLQAEGYLITRRGSGTFVAPELPDPPLVVAGPPPTSALPAPSLSRRGAQIVAGRQIARRVAGPARAFRLGVPALEQFPSTLWARLASRCVAAMTPRDLDYGRGGGNPALRAAIAEHTRSSRGTRSDPAQIYITGGAQRGLELLGRMLLDPGDRAAVEDPGYPGVWTALTCASAQIVPIPVDGEGLSVAALERERGVRLVCVTPSHQFPTGVRMSLPRRRALLAWAARVGGWIVEDDYDCEFRFGAQPIPCLQGLDADGRVIYVGTFSKSIFPALRLGFVIAPPALHAQLIAAQRTMTDPEPPHLDQAVLAEFIASGQFARHLRRMRGIYGERLTVLDDSVARVLGGRLAMRPTRTGLHAVADLIGVDAAQVAAESARRGLEVMPLAAYALRDGAADNALVLGFGAVPPDRLRRGVEDLAEAIEAVERSRDPAPTARRIA
jgi:GntR family transcriptional regulator / MocR family aminotransferase